MLYSVSAGQLCIVFAFYSESALLRLTISASILVRKADTFLCFVCFIDIINIILILLWALF